MFIRHLSGVKVLSQPIKVPNTNIEIIRPFKIKDIKAVLFDFDGTLSHERDGWIDLMIDVFSKELIASTGISQRNAVDWCVDNIQKTIGTPTYAQAESLAKKIKSLGGAYQDPYVYKKRFTAKLAGLIEKKWSAMTKEQLLVKGVGHLLDELSVLCSPNDWYVASGSDVKPILKSIKRLGLDYYFDKENIVAANSLDNPRLCAKEYIIKSLVRKQQLKKGELICFGDGWPEMYHTSKAGGVCIGIITPDKSVYQQQNKFLLSQKKERLINAGAHIIVPDYSNAKELVAIINSNKHFREEATIRQRISKNTFKNTKKK